MDIENILSILSKHRPIFHSEADFQHAIAWQIQREIPNAKIRLELPIPIQNGLIHLDIWVDINKYNVAIELKYKTRILQIEFQGEQFNLRNHAAQDLARYDFIKDIWRLEQIKGNQENVEAYAILLTNDSTYWTETRRENTIDSAFRLSEDRVLTGLLGWSVEASECSINGREDPILLSGDYSVNWKDYSNINLQNNSTFRSLIIKVNNLI